MFTKLKLLIIIAVLLFSNGLCCEDALNKSLNIDSVSALFDGKHFTVDAVSFKAKD